MSIVKNILIIGTAGLILLVAFGCGDDDSSTGPEPSQNTPPELIGTWDWVSASANGVAVASFADVSFTDTSTSQELTFVAGGTWETREYYNGTGPVYARSGTCYDDDSLYITCTNDNGTPESGEGSRAIPGWWSAMH